MREFVNTHSQLLGLIFFWVATTIFLGPVIYVVLPASAFFMRSRDLWPDLIFGFLLVLVMSDMDPGIVPFRAIKSAKYGMMVALALIYFTEPERFTPQAGIFKLFTPFFIFAFLPLVKSSEVPMGVAKTISYGLLYLVIPNYILYNFRRAGWVFFRSLILFIVLMLVMSYGLRFIQPWYVFEGGRYRGLFGNPNGLGIFSLMVFMLFSVSVYLNKDLFSLRGKLLFYAVIAFMLYTCGSRTALVATAMFFIFSRFFSLSPFLGFVIFLTAIAGAEYVSSHLVQIVDLLGIQKFMRVDTLEDGSGRYFAWEFAWQKINQEGFFLFGGGFGNDEFVMRHNYDFLRSQGHDGGVHNSYLTLWFNVGIIGVMLYFIGFFGTFFKANKKAPIAFAVMFSVLFSVLYESWLTGSLNPYTIILVTIMTMLTEDDIVLWRLKEEERELAQENEGELVIEEAPAPLILPAR